MSNKHYIALAKAFARVRPRGDFEVESVRQWNKDVEAVAIVLSDDNNKFDHHRFMTACKQWEGTSV